MGAFRRRSHEGTVLAGNVPAELGYSLFRRKCCVRATPRSFKKYSQMKLQMKREALAKLNRHANEGATSFDTPKPN